MPTSSKSRSARAGPYRAGIVGCGRIGCAFDDVPREASVNTHAGAYKRSPGVELVALADIDREKLDRYGARFEVAGRYTDSVEMLTRERLDILSICTWNDTHAAITEQAVRAGVRAIFCEKPIADSLADADAMIRRCTERGVMLMIDHKRRFDRFHRDVANHVRDGELGRVQQVSCYYTAGLANTASHLLDLLRFFFGDVAWVRGWISSNRSPNSNDPNVDGWLQFLDGPPVSLQACDVAHYVIFEINMLGTQGRLCIVDSGHGVRFEVVRDSDKFDGYRELYPAPSPVDVGGSREFMLQAVEHLVECLDTGSVPVSTGEDGRRALEIICALRLSAQEDGRRIALPLKDCRITIPSR